MKQKTTDEKVYEIMCGIFDEIHAEYMERVPDAGADEFVEQIRFAEDFQRNKHTVAVWKKELDTFEISKEFWKRHEHTTSKIPFYHGDVLHEVNLIVIRADNFECSFQIRDLPSFLIRFKSLSHVRGKHQIVGQRQSVNLEDYDWSEGYFDRYMHWSKEKRKTYDKHQWEYWSKHDGVKVISA